MGIPTTPITNDTDLVRLREALDVLTRALDTVDGRAIIRQLVPQPPVKQPEAWVNTLSALRMCGPLTARNLAKRAGYKVSSMRKVLTAMRAAGRLNYDPENWTYSIRDN